VVLTEGRISLRVMTKCRKVSTENALTGGIGGTTILRSRPSRGTTLGKSHPAGSIAMAGLIQEQTKQAGQRIARLDIADSWSAFQESGFCQQPDRADGHRDALCRRAVAPKELSRPDDGVLLLRQIPNRHCSPRIKPIYGVPGAPNRLGSYQGNFGFITD